MTENKKQWEIHREYQDLYSFRECLIQIIRKHLRQTEFHLKETRSIETNLEEEKLVEKEFIRNEDYHER